MSTQDPIYQWYADQATKAHEIWVKLDPLRQQSLAAARAENWAEYDRIRRLQVPLEKAYEQACYVGD